VGNGISGGVSRDVDFARNAAKQLTCLIRDPEIVVRQVFAALNAEPPRELIILMSQN
jgi:hypothetical protein